MKVDFYSYGLGENSVLVVNRAICHGLRDAGVLRHDRSPALNPAKGGVDWEGVGKMRDMVEPGADVAVCQASVSLEVMQAIKKVSPGTRIVVQRDSSHCQEWHDLVHAEMDKFNIQYTAYGKDLLDREKAEYGLADRITVLSRWVESTFEKHGLGDKVLHVGPQTFDQHKWPRAPEPQGRMFRVLFAGQTGLRKGLHYLLEAWTRLGLPDAQLVVAGVPEPAPGAEHLLTGWVNRQIEGTPACVAPGFVPFDKMAELYASCHVLCLPSVEEGSSMTVLEAMSVGRPVVASTHAGADVLEHGVNGFLVNPCEWEPIADALHCYHADRERWRVHAAAAAVSVEGCDIPNFGARYVARLREAFPDL